MSIYYYYCGLYYHVHTIVRTAHTTHIYPGTMFPRIDGFIIIRMYLISELMKLFVSSLLYVGCFVCCHAFFKTDTRALNKNVSDLLNHLLSEGKYDKRIRPDIGGM
jgi:hypothetical protein